MTNFAKTLSLGEKDCVDNLNNNVRPYRKEL